LFYTHVKLGLLP